MKATLVLRYKRVAAIVGYYTKWAQQDEALSTALHRIVRLVVQVILL